MSFKSYDYICTNEKCEKYNTKEELLVKDKDKDSMKCKSCGEVLNRGFGVSAIKTNDNSGRLKI